jgi:urocanate hydratase
MQSKVVAQTGLDIRCKGWIQESILRMLENTVQNGEDPDRLIIYGGEAKAARSWESYFAIVDLLKNLQGDETLVIQSGKPVGVFRTRTESPRVILANSHLVPRWATWDNFRKLERKGLTMYGQYKAGDWGFIGLQGMILNTDVTYRLCSLKYFGGTLQGRIVLSAGLGATGGAQPLAIKLNDGVALVIEVDSRRIERRMALGFCDSVVQTCEEAIEQAVAAAKRGVATSIALHANAADAMPRLLELGLRPDVVTDQTAAHDPLNGYIPRGHSVEEAARLRNSDPARYMDEAYKSIALHVKALLDFQSQGAVAFEYGNFNRAQAVEAGVSNAFDMPGFIPLLFREEFSNGRGPFRWVAISGNPKDIDCIDRALLEEFSSNAEFCRWLRLAKDKVPSTGLPARTSWLGLGDRARVGRIINDLIDSKRVSAPVAMSRDHLDSGAVAQPTRETEGMMDGSDTIADWPILNAMLNTAAGADLVASHQGGGGGMGASISAGLTVIADGSHAAREKLERVLTTDPGIGVLRHADAGYPEARAAAKRGGLQFPGVPSIPQA